MFLCVRYVYVCTVCVCVNGMCSCVHVSVGYVCLYGMCVRPGCVCVRYVFLCTVCAYGVCVRVCYLCVCVLMVCVCVCVCVTPQVLADAVSRLVVDKFSELTENFTSPHARRKVLAGVVMTTGR